MKDDAIAVEAFFASGMDVFQVKNPAKMTALQLATDRGKTAVRACLEKLAAAPPPALALAPGADAQEEVDKKRQEEEAEKTRLQEEAVEKKRIEEEEAERKRQEEE